MEFPVTISDVDGVAISEKSIAELQQLQTNSLITAVQLTEAYLAYIKLVNPYTRSVIQLNPDAVNIAAQLDQERASGRVRGILHGIPCLIKDNIATDDETETTAGCSEALIGSRPPADAFVVQQLRKAGAVILGKANCTELACMRSSWYSEGYSSRGGQTRNPYNLAAQPGGSSGGSAGAVAANLCVFSLGTETDNSIIFPADRNGVVGIKPTVGLTSRRGALPLSRVLDSVGPFARTVADAATVLEVISEFDASDQVPLKRPLDLQRQYSAAVTDAPAIRGARFGIPRRLVWDLAKSQGSLQPEYKQLVEILDLLKVAGADLVDPADFPDANEMISPNGWDWKYGTTLSQPYRSEAVVCDIEFVEETAKYLSALKINPNDIRSVQDIIDYNIKHTESEGGVPGSHPAWPRGQDALFGAIETQKNCPRKAYEEAIKWMHSVSRERGIDAALATGCVAGETLDALLVPVNCGLHVATSVAAKAGYPMISIPIGLGEDGTPFSLGLIHTAWQEARLIKWASAIEDLLAKKGRRGRQLPTFQNLHATNWHFLGI